VIESGEPEVSKFGKLAKEYPEDTSEACAAFSRQVGIVEGILIHTYGIAANLTKQSESLPVVASTWTSMAGFCDSVIQQLLKINEAHPDCGGAGLYDRALDFKLAAQKRLNAVMQEITCQTETNPTGLFPEVS